MATLPLSTILAAPSEPVDTLIHIGRPSNIIISESESGITVKFKDLESTGESTILIADYNKNGTVFTSQQFNRHQELAFNRCAFGVKHNSHIEVITGGINIGLVNSLDQPSGMGLQWSKSFEIGWLNALAVRYNYKTISLSLGIGFDWRNYKMTGSSHYMVKDPENGIGLHPYPQSVTPGSSRIKIFSLGFPLLYSQKIPGTTLAFTAGAILNVNTHASLLTRYRNDKGNDIEEYAEGIMHRRVSYDIYGSVTLYKNIGIYVRYSPQTVLKHPTAPEFKPLSVGLSFFL